MVVSPDMAGRSAVNGQLEFSVISSSIGGAPLSEQVILRKLP